MRLTPHRAATRPGRLARATLAGCIVLSGCTDSGPRNPIVQPGRTTLNRPGLTVAVRVTPGRAIFDPGQTIQFAAIALDSRGGRIAGREFTWASSAPGVATVSSTGLVTSVAKGAASISAASDDKTGTATISVNASFPGARTIVAAGDIAECGSSKDEATALLLDSIPGTIALLGDNVYENGSTAEYADCYGPSWGRHKSRTKPSAGNHEYQTTNASGYYGYFGTAAGDPAKGYYSYDIADWHIVVLNSNCGVVSCAAGSAQEQWLRADLAANRQLCTLAYFHHPRFNSGATHGNTAAVAPFWDALQQLGADVILNGHEHLYERFAPQTAAAVADPANGIRQFTVGTGGRAFYTVGTIQPNSEIRNNTANGVLKLTLNVGTYTWQFVPVAGQTFTDAGTGKCH